MSDLKGYIRVSDLKRMVKHSEDIGDYVPYKDIDLIKRVDGDISDELKDKLKAFAFEYGHCFRPRAKNFGSYYSIEYLEGGLCMAQFTGDAPKSRIWFDDKATTRLAMVLYEKELLDYFAKLKENTDAYYVGCKYCDGNDYVEIALDGDTIVTIDTENVQDSIRDAFCDSGWEAGESFGFGTGDVFRADEYDNYFDIYANDKMIARFCKDRLFR